MAGQAAYSVREEEYICEQCPRLMCRIQFSDTNPGADAYIKLHRREDITKMKVLKNALKR